MFFFIFYLVWLMLGWIPKMGLVTCLEVLKKFLWVVGGVVVVQKVNIVILFGLALA